MKQLLKNIVVRILTWEARLTLRHYAPKIIAITGSVGKTSTKDAIFKVISAKFNARRSEKSFNSEIGVPLTVLGLENAWTNPLGWVYNIMVGFFTIFFSANYPRILVLEIGADHPGDIKSICSWVKPDIAVVTALADVPVHVENFGTPEKVYEEKRHLIEALKQDGIAILNADDRRVFEFRKLERNGTRWRRMSFGIRERADVVASYPTVVYDSSGKPTGMAFKIDHDGKSIPAEINGSVGIAPIYSALAAAAVGIALGLNIIEIANRVKQISAPRGRLKLLEGINGSTIIDDSYNSSPIAVDVALNTLKNIELKVGGRRIAALGDMRELGDYSEQEHKRIGKLASSNVDLLITVGPKSRFVAEGARQAGMSKESVYEFPTPNTGSAEAGEFAGSIIGEGDVILVKGSQNTIRMERFVERVMAHSERKNELLVRQEKEWKNR